MTKLTYDVFKMQMDSFAVYLNTSLKKEVLENDYWPILKKYNSQWFADAVQWLKENYEYKRFPLISDFKKAFMCTRSTKYVPDGPRRVQEKIDPIEYKKDFQKLVDKFTPPEQQQKADAKHRQRNMYLKAQAEKKVFSYKLHKWVHRSLMNNIGGEFILPEERL